MNPAMDLVRIVEQNGGRISVDGDALVIFPDRVAMSIIDKLKEHKQEIIAALEPWRHDPTEWREPFVRWVDFSCVWNPRFFAELKCLHNAYCDLIIAQGDVPCNIDTFQTMLKELSFQIGEVEGVILVSSLALRGDVEAMGLRTL
jgi:hypothetical protein